MRHYTELTPNELDLIRQPSIKTNKKVEYVNMEVAFDIETSSIYLNEDKSAFMYIWMFGLGDGEHIYYGRTWNEFMEFLQMIQIHYQLDNYKRMIVYVHNLGYEFQFMRKYFTWLNIFAVDERKPLKALCDLGFEFRDSYILSGYSLEKTADNLQHHQIEKLSGDLDYSLVRTHRTQMSDEEMAYCHNDIEIILAYINEQIVQYSDITKIPLTNTGRVRSFVRDNCYYTSTNHRKSSKGKYNRYRKIMNDLRLTKTDYILLKYAFMGGFTHANAHYSGKLLHNVSSIDFTSSYPAVMLAEQFPMSKGKQVRILNQKQFDNYLNNYCLLFDIQLKNVKATFDHDNYISKSKCRNLEGVVDNNGRIHKAESLTMTITDVDFKIIQNSYTWDSMEIGTAIRFHKGYLPKPIIESILELYQNKTELKGVEGYETEYLLSKGMLNSIYGMSVTDVVKEDSKYNDEDDEWYTEPADIKEQIKVYNNNKNRFLFYAWGIWITAYARKNLWTGILNIGSDYVYSDTDSIKLLNYENHTDYIQKYNEAQIMKMETMCNHYKLDKRLLNPKTKNGVRKMIGVWDFEGTYTRFKTLGAKRYLVEEDGKLFLTVAGLSKQKGLEYMLKWCQGNHKAVFDLFTDDLYIPAEHTGKMTHTYIDSPMRFTINDYQGNPSDVESLSSIHLENAEFTLSISRRYQTFLQEFMRGYTYKGVKHR